MTAVTNSIHDRDESVRVASLRSLGDIGQKSPMAAPSVLSTALEDRSAEVRASTAMALAHVGLGIDSFVSTIVRHAEDDPDASVREACTQALQELGPPAITSRSVPDLIAALGSQVGNVRIASAVALARLGRPARPAIPALIRAIRSPVGEDDAQRERAR